MRYNKIMPFEGPPVTNPEALSLAAEMDDVLNSINIKIDDLLKRVGNGEVLDRENLKEVTSLFAKAKNIFIRLTLKKNSGILTTENLSKYSEKVEELKEAYGVLSEEIESQNPATKSPQTMTYDEVVAVEERLIDDTSDKFGEINQRFLELASKQPTLKEAEGRCKRGLQAVLAKGDTGEKDFSVGWPEVTGQLINKTTNFIDIGRYLFTVHDEKTRQETPVEKVDSLPINEDTIAMWHYMKDRIKGKYGGKPFNKNNPQGVHDGNFDYGALSGDVIKRFEAHLREKFPNIEPGIFDQMMKFAQGVGPIKDVAYVAWLFKETTRSHGSGHARLKNYKFEDPLFVTAFIQAGAYSRGRYGDIIPNATSPDMIFFTKEMAGDIVPSGNPEKRKSSEALWEIVNEFFTHILWRGTPSFIKDVRKMFGIDIQPGDPDKKIDMYESIFPFPGEVVVNAYEIELEKRKLLKSHESKINGLKAKIDDLIKEKESLQDDAAKEKIEDEIRKFKGKLSTARNEMVEDKKMFLAKHERYGYGSYDDKTDPKLDKVGIGYLKKDPEGHGGYGLSITQYNTSFEAMNKMSEFFHSPLGTLTEQQCIDKWTYWMQSIIGKAKLIPGKHFLLFPHFSMLAAIKIVASYDYSNKSYKVNKLLDRMMSELRNAGGMPQYVKDEVVRYMEKDKKHFGVYELMDAGEYVRKLYAYRNRVLKGWEQKIRKAIPLGLAAVDNDGMKMGVSTPWFWDEKADKDTSGSGK